MDSSDYIAISALGFSVLSGVGNFAYTIHGDRRAARARIAEREPQMSVSAALAVTPVIDGICISIKAVNTGLVPVEVSGLGFVVEGLDGTIAMVPERGIGDALPAVVQPALAWTGLVRWSGNGGIQKTFEREVPTNGQGWSCTPFVSTSRDVRFTGEPDHWPQR